MAQWILTSSVLILLVLAVRGVFKKRMKAKAVYALWLIVLVRLLCPVNFGELSFNLLSLVQEGKAEVEERQFLVSEGTYILPENAIFYYPTEAGIVEEIQTEQSVAETVTEVQGTIPEFITEAQAAEEAGFSFPEIAWQKVLLVVWIAGMVCLAIVIFGVNISFSTTLGMLRKELPLLARKGRGKKELSVYLADGINSSCLYGVIHPSIYLNEQGMSDREKSYCVEHEYSHYLQGDAVWSLCRTLCLILHWYNPLVWVAVMLSKKDAELACDECTIERLGEEERYSYGHTLVELAAKQSKAVQMFGMATLMASDKKEVVERVKAITTKKQTKLITGLLVTALVVGIGFFVFTGEAKGEQDNNTSEAPVATETPVPTEKAEPAEEKDTLLAETSRLAVSKEELAQTAEFLEYVLTENKFPIEGYVVAHDQIRSKPGKISNAQGIKGTISPGNKITVLGVEKDNFGKDWFQVEYSRKKQDKEELLTGYVESDCIIQSKSFRLYEQRDTESSYTEHLYYPHYIKNMRDSGDECWFFIGTEDGECGWVLYGEHEGMDAQIRNGLLQVSAEEYEENRARRKQEVKTAINDNYVFLPLTFTDHVALKYKEREGWLIDLDGDGTEEQLCIGGDAVFIDGEVQTSYPVGSKHSFWLLDIDTTDGRYELLDNTGNMYIYNGKALQKVKGIREALFCDVCILENGKLVPITESDVRNNPTSFFIDSNGAIYARYLPKLYEFTRIDEHTICFENYFCVGASFMASPQYVLDEKHGLQMVSMEYDVISLSPAGRITNLKLKNEAEGMFKVYEARDLSGNYTEYPALSDVTLLKSDCVEWVYIEASDGTMGWVYFCEEPEYYFSFCKEE